MADSCSELSAQIAALRAEIAAIPRVDENAIVARAKSVTEASIMPQIPQIALGLIVSRIAPVQAQAANAEKLASTGIDAARQALERAYQAKSAAEIADGTAKTALSGARDALSRAGVAIND